MPPTLSPDDRARLRCWGAIPVLPLGVCFCLIGRFPSVPGRIGMVLLGMALYLLAVRLISAHVPHSPIQATPRSRTGEMARVNEVTTSLPRGSIPWSV